jgi:hypothetical protein
MGFADSDESENNANDEGNINAADEANHRKQT